MLCSSDWKQHIELQDRVTKHQRANKLYGQYTFDTALPQNWVKDMICMTGHTHGEIVSQFVWLYFDHDAFGQPAPLTLEGCEMLRIARQEE